VFDARLNEGFATWVGWLAIDRLYPEWDIWSKFTSEALQAALTMDSMKSSHAIEVEVNNALEIDQIFDAISYYKGSSCIHMLSKFLGVETFLKVRWLAVRCLL
jgi:aminopeptidase 2